MFLEKDLEEYFVKNPDALKALLGLDNGKIEVKQQLSLGSYGIADIVVFDDGIIHVVELKRNGAKAEDFFQLARYVKGLTHFFPYATICPLLFVEKSDFCQKHDFVFLAELGLSVDFVEFEIMLKEGLIYKKHDLEDFDLCEKGKIADEKLRKSWNKRIATLKENGVI